MDKKLTIGRKWWYKKEIFGILPLFLTGMRAVELYVDDRGLDIYKNGERIERLEFSVIEDFDIDEFDGKKGIVIKKGGQRHILIPRYSIFSPGRKAASNRDLINLIALLKYSSGKKDGRERRKNPVSILKERIGNATVFIKNITEGILDRLAKKYGIDLTEQSSTEGTAEKVTKEVTEKTARRESVKKEEGDAEKESPSGKNKDNTPEITCGICGNPNPIWASYCSKCGSELVEDTKQRSDGLIDIPGKPGIICPFCGFAGLTEKDAFCPQCGNLVKDGNEENKG